MYMYINDILISACGTRVHSLLLFLFYQVTEKFYTMFYGFEDDEILNISDPIHKQALRMTFLKEINNSLEKFQKAWNCHQIRTASHKTPTRLWLDGMLQNQNSNHTAVRDIFNHSDMLEEKIQEYLQNHQELSGDGVVITSADELMHLDEQQKQQLEES